MFDLQQIKEFIERYGIREEMGWLAFDLNKEDEILVKYVRDTTKAGFIEHKQMHDKYLTMGEIYKVKKIRMNDSFTLLFLDGVPKGFNSVHFDIVNN